MGIFNAEQDFADRWYKFFGGRKNFGYLTHSAKKYGVGVCDEVAQTIRQEIDLPENARIKYFHKVLWNKHSNSTF